MSRQNKISCDGFVKIAPEHVGKEVTIIIKANLNNVTYVNNFDNGKSMQSRIQKPILTGRHTEIEFVETGVQFEFGDGLSVLLDKIETLEEENAHLCRKLLNQ